MKSNHGRLMLILGSLLAGIAVALGAFGSHALETIVSADRVETWQTAVRYQLFHALALLILGILTFVIRAVTLAIPAWCFLLGTLFFSGSLYLLVLLNLPILGALTPIGGALYLLGWGSMLYLLWRWHPNPE